MKETNGFKRWLRRKVEEGTEGVVEFQKRCGVSFPPSPSPSLPVPFVISNRFLFLLFSFGSSLGEELFYILFLPNFGWTIHMGLAKKLITMWAVMYYVGQTLKDILKLPRPPSPPVAHLSPSPYLLEYGLPSTHAMAALSVPFFISFHLTPPLPLLREEGSGGVVGCVVMMWVGAVVWSVAMTLSRLYFGLHSLFDLLSGALLGLGALGLFIGVGDEIDEWVMTSPHGGWVVVGVGVVMVGAFKVMTRPERWTPCYGETVLIVGVGVGVSLGALSSSSFLPSFPPSLFFFLPSSSPPLRWMIIFLIRSIIGYAILFGIRTIVKFISINILIRIIKLPPKVDLKKYYPIEIPTKFFTYTAVGYVAVVLPVLFDFLSLNLS